MVRPALPTDDTTLVLRRTYDAPVDVVYQAWTDPAQIQRWLRPNSEIRALFVEVDLRVGGTFRIGYDAGDDKEPNVIAGHYREIVPHKRLAFSWTWTHHPDFAGEETLVTVEFEAVDGRTHLTLTHTRFPTKSMRDTHVWGWTGATDKLVEHVRFVCRTIPDGQRPF